MRCYRPLQCWKLEDGAISFSRRSDLPMQVPCGQCIGCRLARSREWACRIMHEVSLHDENCFVTLTYDPEHLPAGGALKKSDFQDFMRRLRRFYAGESISYFHCGEYGEENARPHYHAILFGVWFPDARLHKHNGRGEPLFESAALTRLWGKGGCLVGAVTFESAAYVARYTCSKITGSDYVSKLAAQVAYERVDKVTGEVVQVPPEYATMSLRPAIGKRWFEKYGAEVLATDSVVMRGVEMGVPRYYDKLRDRAELKEAKKERKKGMRKHAKDLTRKRLAVREAVAESKYQFLGRKLS